MNLDIKENIDLKQFSTMRLGGIARYFTSVSMPGHLPEAIHWAKEQNLPWRIIGGGSNIIFTDEGFNGLIIHNEIKGVSIANDGDEVLLQAGAGENWDDVVRVACEQKLYGIAELSLIPGTVGATPVQNVGAYGREVSEILSSIEAYDTQTSNWVVFGPENCGFAYRTSIFNDSEKGRYAIASVSYRLSHHPLNTSTYESLAHYLDQYNINDREPLTIRNAVIAVRQSKLPNPEEIPNTGSFFKNPIVDPVEAAQLLGQYPKAPHFHLPDGRIKLSAGWLIDQAELKGYENHGLKTYRKNALVIVNDHATKFAELVAFRDEIASKVKERFGIQLTQEPEII